MDSNPDDLPHDLFVAEEPPVLHAEDGQAWFAFPGDPALKFIPDPAHAPEIVFLAADFDVRPRPIKTAMIRVIRGKVVGQHLSIEAVDGMDVARTRVRRLHARLAQDAVIINEDRP